MQFPCLPLDLLLGLDGERSDPDAHARFGYATAPSLRLEGRFGRSVSLADCAVVGVHRSDDQSQVRPQGLDLEFETPEGDVVVDLGEFVQKRLLGLAGSWGGVVLALCNPDRVPLKRWILPLTTVVSGPVYWAFGEVLAGADGPKGQRVLQAERWFRVGA